MKLRELRRKKTIMALTAIALVWLDLYFLDQSNWYSKVHLLVPFDRYCEKTFGSLVGSILPWYPEIITLTTLGTLLGKDTRERLKLVIIGLVVAYLFLFAGLVFLIGSGTSH